MPNLGSGTERLFEMYPLREFTSLRFRDSSCHDGKIFRIRSTPGLYSFESHLQSARSALSTDTLPEQPWLRSLTRTRASRTWSKNYT